MGLVASVRVKTTVHLVINRRIPDRGGPPLKINSSTRGGIFSFNHDAVSMTPEDKALRRRFSSVFVLPLIAEQMQLACKVASISRDERDDNGRCDGVT
jgi:hypothetical protein